MFRKEAGWTGLSFYYHTKYGNPQGIGNTLGTAITAVNSSSGVQWAAARAKTYGYITLDGEAMAASENDKGAFMDLVTTETEGVLEEVGDTLAFDFWRDGTGNRGQRSSASTNVITLTTADDARNFKVGMLVAASANADGSSARTGTTTVAGVDMDAGTVTLTSAAAIASFANSDYMFRSGNITCWDGMSDLIPLTAPTSGSTFRGVDRYVDNRLLAGARINDTSTPIEENAGLLGVKIRQSGQKANAGFVNPVKFWEVVRRLNAKVCYDGGGMKAAYGFESIDIHTPAGAIKLVSEPDLPTNRGYIGKLEDVYIKHLKGFVHIISDDGRANLRQASDDGIEARVRHMGNVIHKRPASWGVFAI